jgi:hypothetical protein
MHALLWNMPIYYMEIWYSKCHTLHQVGAKILCPNLTPMHSLSLPPPTGEEPRMGWWWILLLNHCYIKHPPKHFFGVPIGEERVPKHQTIVDIYFFIHGWELFGWCYKWTRKPDCHTFNPSKASLLSPKKNGYYLHIDKCLPMWFRG